MQQFHSFDPKVKRGNAIAHMRINTYDMIRFHQSYVQCTHMFVKFGKKKEAKKHICNPKKGGMLTPAFLQNKPNLVVNEKSKENYDQIS